MPFCEAMKVKPGNIKMFKMPESWDTDQGKLLARHGTSPTKNSKLQSTELEGIGDLNSVLPSDMVFSLTLVQYFLILLPFLLE